MTHLEYKADFDKKVGRLSFKSTITRKILGLIFLIAIFYFIIKLKNILTSDTFLKTVSENSSALNIILTSILIIVTAIYVIYTGIYVKITHRILKETVISRTLQYRPTFFISFANTFVSETEVFSANDGKTTALAIAFDIVIDNYSKSFAYNPQLCLHYPYKKTDDKNWDIIRNEITLTEKLKFAPEKTIQQNIQFHIYSLDFNSIPQPAIHLEFFYEDGERNLFSNSLFMLLKEEAGSNGQKFFVKSVREEIYLLSKDKRTNVFDRVLQVFSFDYQKAEKLFSRYDPFS